jgi:hypothetical protein
MEKTGGFAFSDPDESMRKGDIVGAVGTDNAGAVLPRSDPAIIHPR